MWQNAHFAKGRGKKRATAVGNQVTNLEVKLKKAKALHGQAIEVAAQSDTRHRMRHQSFKVKGSA